MKKVKVDVQPNLCKGCYYCIGVCPQKVFEAHDHKNVRGFPYVEATNADACIGCKQCTIICPDAAIWLYEED